MSGIKAVDKLRGLPFHGTNGFGTCVTASKGTINSIADEIEAEIEEFYMRLPVDVNNEPVHIGDEMEHRSKHETLDVIAVGNNSFFTGRWADNYVRCVEVSAQWHHVKPRTLEDVLRDAMQFGHDDNTVGERADEVIAKYADEIRELMGGDAE